MADPKPIDCPECSEGNESLSRRDFVRVLSGAALAGGLLPRLGAASPFAPAARKGDPESAVKRFHDTLTADQKKVVCMPWSDAKRTRINANWAITEMTVDDLKKDQQAIVDEIFRGVTSPDGYDRFQKQMKDDHGGIGSYSVALFGEPGSGQYEWVMTGRHLTIRADGDSTEGAAFGGPIIYGHGEGDSKKGLPGNVFYYQTKKANEVFSALDGTQRAKALVSKAPAESRVALQGQKGTFQGISVGEMSKDQKALVESTMKVLLAPYREKDVNEALDVMKAGGGLDALHMAFYEAEDIGGDHEWDLWRLEGPTFVWHFRGAPHVHAYVNVSKKV
ncbi:MAG: hypothetical protein JWN86_3852 [Planctomycetota bacterium]|nr:hypothetical protein [Planctomycetota bacterium]